jgi:hypothetical protein
LKALICHASQLRLNCNLEVNLESKNNVVTAQLVVMHDSPVRIGTYPWWHYGCITVFEQFSGADWSPSRRDIMSISPAFQRRENHRPVIKSRRDG